MPDIFLSYSREDKATARHFATALERAGFSVWWDQTLRSGDAYDKVTETALREAKAVVVLWSRKSVDSRWVRAEATLADRNGTLLPAMIEACDRPVMFELTQAADLSHWKGNAHDSRWTAFLDDVRRFVSVRKDAARPAAALSMRSRWRSVWLFMYVAALFLVAAGAWLSSTGRLEFLERSSAEPPSIAVLPFDDMTSAGSDAPLAEGLAEEISNWLVHIPNLRVVARHSAFMFRGPDRDMRKVGQQLGATHLLEGSLRRGAGQLRVTVQLVSARDGYHLWSKSFNFPDGDPLRVEDAVSRAVAQSLNVRLSPQTEGRWKARQAQAPEAQGLWLEGQAEYRRQTPQHNLRALELYRRALELDPRFPLAYVSLAEATLNSVRLNGRELPAAAAQSAPLLERALALSPDLPEAIAVQGRLAMDQYRMDDALVLLQRALTLNPNDVDTQRRMGLLYGLQARPSLAMESFERAAELDPLDFLTHLNRCLSLQDLAQYTAAQAACARARQLDASNWWGANATAWLAFGTGDLAGALAWTNRAAQLAPADVEMQDQRVRILLALQKYDEARAAIQRLPADAEPMRSFLNATLAAERNDAQSLGSIVDGIARRDDLAPGEWLELASLQLTAADAQSALTSLQHARRSQSWQSAELVDPSYVRNGYSGAAIVAAVELAAGDREAALRTLAPLDEMLDRMEGAGAACSGLHLLRAVSLALHGDPGRSMASLERAYQQGWRLSQQARTEPLLESLKQREDFRALLARIDRQIRAIRVEPDALPP